MIIGFLKNINFSWIYAIYINFWTIHFSSHLIPLLALAIRWLKSHRWLTNLFTIFNNKMSLTVERTCHLYNLRRKIWIPLLFLFN